MLRGGGGGGGAKVLESGARFAGCECSGDGDDGCQGEEGVGEVGGVEEEGFHGRGAIVGHVEG